MGAPGLTTPLRSETFENLQLNAGIFIKNLAYSGTGAPADAKLTTTLVEITKDNVLMALAMPSTAATTSGKVTTIKMHTEIASGDYIDNLCWCGDLADGRMVLICLKNALNTADFSLTFTDKGEGTLPIEVHAHQANVDDYDEAPFEIVFFDLPAVQSGP